jgi:phage-related protein (TIGR01555 family)
MGGATGSQATLARNRFSQHSQVGFIHPLLNQEQLLHYYIYAQPCANAVDVVPNNALKDVPVIVPKNPDVDPELMALAIDFMKSSLPVVRLAAHLSRLYGWAIIPIFTEGDDMEAPPNYDAGGIIKDIRAIPGGMSFDASVHSYWDDPHSRRYGDPMLYRIPPNILIHADRCILMKGLPDNRPLKQRGGYALGYSVIEPMAQAWDDYLSAICANRKILDDKSIDVIKIPNFRQILKNPKELKAVIDALRVCRREMGGYVLDAEADFIVADRSLTGINDAMSQFMTQISMQANLTDTIVFGISPAGLTSGSYETGVLEKLTSNYQQSELVPVWRKLLDTLFTLQGQADFRYELKFPSSIETTELEQSEIDSAKAKAFNDLSTALATLVNLKIMKEEVAAAIANNAIDGITEKVVMSSIGEGDEDLLPEEADEPASEPYPVGFHRTQPLRPPAAI